ncbi:hypothetical protein MRX96_036277 [Rhipicephalus microplus]
MRQETRESRDPLHADMHSLWREPSFRHMLVQGQDARASTTDIAETSAASAFEEGLSTSSAPSTSPGSLDENHQWAQNITVGRRRSTPAGRGKAPEGSH